LQKAEGRKTTCQVLCWQKFNQDCAEEKEMVGVLCVLSVQGCQMVCFQTKNPNLGKFRRSLDWKMFKYFMAIWVILWTLGIFYDRLLSFVFIWYLFRFWYHVQRKIWQPCLGPAKFLQNWTKNSAHSKLEIAFDDRPT
jgi:hypothetical protein